MERNKKKGGMKRSERKRRGSKTGREEQYHPVADPSLRPNLPCLEMKMEANSHLPSYGPAPLLVFSHGKRERTKTIFNISNGSFNVKNIPEMRRTYCLASYFGWLVMLDKTCGDLFLLNFVSLQKIQLPYLSPLHFAHFILSAPPTDPDCAILSIGCSTDFLIYCRPGGDKWIKRTYRNGEGETCIWKVVPCNGKLYAYGLQEEFGIIDVNANPPLIWLEPKRPASHLMYAVTNRFLVESCGEIFLAEWNQLLAVPRVPRVEVYKMDFDRMTWVKVDTIGDRVLFLGRNCSTSCSATDSGMKRDCIYFTKPDDLNLYVFHMDRGTVSVDLPCPNVRPPWVNPFWVTPTV